MADDYICAESRKSKRHMRKKRGFNIYKKGGHERGIKRV
jgi:hypothetical protein